MDLESNFWWDANEKEMKNVRPASKATGWPPGYKKIPFHMVFGVKADLVCEAWIFVGGHVTDPPSMLTFSSVVPRQCTCCIFDQCLE